ncbi:HAMP domain-containing sensor histidine kinase [Anaerolentibacter hominis]|uniref:sensor histidine kinase n=1 Tax=Anaerolentibacter hominis TaxID=3079009 RepID=UPI0031B86763
MKHSFRNNKRSVILIVGSLLGAILIFNLLFHLDNKYTRDGVRGQNGTLVVTDGDIRSPLFLIDGWEASPGLVPPDQFSASGRSVTFIGEYSNFTWLTGSPYGEATYRLTVSYTGKEEVLSLYFPELLCASAVWINGEQAAGAGTLDPYHPLVRDLTVSFPACQETEIVVQTANHTHYFGGMFYPPSLGTSDTIQRMTGTRLLFYGFCCFTALSIAFLCLGFWLFHRDLRTGYRLGIFALFFAIHTAYPFFRLLGAPLTSSLYALEDVSFYLMLGSAISVCTQLCGFSRSRWYRSLIRPSVWSMCLISIVIPPLLPVLPGFLPVYSWIVTIIRILCALYLLLCAWFGRSKSGLQYSGLVLSGCTIFSALLLAGTLSINYFEPTRTGWPEEYGGMVLILFYAFLVALESRRLIAENRVLTADLQQEVEKQTENLSLQLQERKHFLSESIHDLKAPLTTLNNYIQAIRFNEVELDDELLEYLEVIEQKYEDMKDKIYELQAFSAADEAPFCPEPVCLNDFLSEYHRLNKPDIEVIGADFHLYLPRKELYIRGDRRRLTHMLENLVYNAAGLIGEGGSISLRLSSQEENAVLTVSDTGPGISPEDLPKIFDRHFSKRAGGSGLGLFIARSAVLEHSGTISVSSEPGTGTIFTIVLPLMQMNTEDI